MIRSILVALDETEASQTAKHFAIHLAQIHRASLTGIGVLDEPWITAPEAVPIGGAAFKAELDMQMLEDAKKRVRKLEKDFKANCEKTKLDFKVLDAIGAPYEEISKHCVSHDLLVVGKDAEFHFVPTLGPSAPVQELLKKNPRPLILTGREDASGKDVIIGFDGTRASAKAIHMAILLGFLKKNQIHLVTVAPTVAGAKKIMAPALELLKHHKLEPKVHAIGSSNRPSDEILKLADKLNPSLLVIGAFGHRGIQYLFSGSCTKMLLRDSTYPFFLYH